jgi:autotransporter-associated beta strand protein
LIQSSVSTVWVGDGGGTIDDAGNTVRIDKPVLGTGWLTKTGAGTLTLTGANTCGGMTNRQGTLVLSPASSYAGDFINDATLQLDVNGEFRRNIGGTGLIRKTSDGDLVLLDVTVADSQTWSIGSATGNGRVFYDSQANLGTGDIALVGGAGCGILLRRDGADLTLANAITMDSNAVLGNRANVLSVPNLTLPAGGVVTFNKDDAVTSTLYLNGPALALAGNLTVSVGGGNPTVGAVTLRNAISGTGFGLTKGGPGTLILAGTNTYTGPTTISGGVLAIGADGSVADTPLITVAGGAMFDVSAPAAGYVLTNNQTLAGSGAVTGSVVAAAGSVVSGGSTNDVGSLSLSNDLTLQPGAVIVWNYDVGSGTADAIHVGGTLTLPATATLIASGTGPFTDGGLVFSAGALAGATDLSGWTCLAPKRMHVAISGNDVFLRESSGTLIMMH